MVVDSHQHFWAIARQDYGFLSPSNSVLYRDYLPTMLRPILQASGVAGTVTIQAAATLEETLWLLDLVQDVDFVWGVVGWLDLDTPPSVFRPALQALQRTRKFVGLRPMLQDLEDDRWILRSSVLTNMTRLADEGIPMDILVFPRHLPYVAEALERVPHLRAVIDHLAKPPIASQQLEPWSSWLAVVARHQHVWCKLSGMVTEANWQHWRPDHFKPYVYRALDLFGPERVMYGSDWPVCLNAASYQTVFNLLQEVLPSDLCPSHRHAVFGENARRFYHLSP